MTKEEKRDNQRQEQREKIEAAMAQLRTSEGWIKWIRTRKLISRFSLSNQFLIALQKSDATDVRTYKAWQQVGRQVRKGERSILLLQPVFVKVKEIVDGKEVETQKLVGFRNLREFDVSQTDGEPLPQMPIEDIEGDSHAHLLPVLVEFAQERGYTVDFDTESKRGEQGSVNLQTKVISIVKDQSKNKQVTTLIHEIAHTFDVDYVNYYRDQAEVIVESVTMMVCEGLGLDTSGFSVAYLTGWDRPGDAKALREFASVIDKIANTIEDRIEEGVKVVI